MSLLGVDYGSDSDAEGNQQQQQSSAPPPPPFSSASSHALLPETATDGKKHKKKDKKPKKKKAKVALSILPAHIQAALMRAVPLRRARDSSKGVTGGRFLSDDDGDEDEDDDDLDGAGEEEELDDEVRERQPWCSENMDLLALPFLTSRLLVNPFQHSHEPLLLPNSGARTPPQDPSSSRREQSHRFSSSRWCDGLVRPPAQTQSRRSSRSGSRQKQQSRCRKEEGKRYKRSSSSSSSSGGSSSGS